MAWGTKAPKQMGDWSAYWIPGNERPVGIDVQTTLGTVVAGLDRLQAVAQPIGGRVRLDRLIFDVSAGGAAGSVGRVGIYKAISRTNPLPGSLIVDGGEVVTTAASRKYSVVDVTLTPGLYWFAWLFGVAAPTVRTFNALANPIAGVTAASPPLLQQRLNVVQAYGALPASFPGGANWESLASVGYWVRPV